MMAIYCTLTKGHLLKHPLKNHQYNWGNDNSFKEKYYHSKLQKVFSFLIDCMKLKTWSEVDKVVIKAMCILHVVIYELFFPCNAKPGGGERGGRYKTFFYACNCYPDCKYAIKYPPVAEACPQCNWPILSLKSTKKSGAEHVCPEKDCGYTVSVATEEWTIWQTNCLFATKK